MYLYGHKLPFDIDVLRFQNGELLAHFELLLILLIVEHALRASTPLQPSDNLTEASVAVFHDLSAFVDTFKSFKHN